MAYGDHRHRAGSRYILKRLAQALLIDESDLTVY
jgi:hypothetical protein